MELDGTYTTWNPIGGKRLVIVDDKYTLKEHVHLEYFEVSGVLRMENNIVILGPNEVYTTPQRYRAVMVGKDAYLLRESKYEEFLKRGIRKEYDEYRKIH